MPGPHTILCLAPLPCGSGARRWTGDLPAARYHPDLSSCRRSLTVCSSKAGPTPACLSRRTPAPIPGHGIAAGHTRALRRARPVHCFPTCPPPVDGRATSGMPRRFTGYTTSYSGAAAPSSAPIRPGCAEAPALPREVCPTGTHRAWRRRGPAWPWAFLGPPSAVPTGSSHDPTPEHAPCSGLLRPAGGDPQASGYAGPPAYTGTPIPTPRGETGP